MIDKKSWDEFRTTGLMWWINQSLHLFGWAIVVDIDKDGRVIDCYPARVKFRGFTEKINDEGYQKISKYLEVNSQQLKKEAFEEK